MDLKTKGTYPWCLLFVHRPTSSLTEKMRSWRIKSVCFMRGISCWEQRGTLFYYKWGIYFKDKKNSALSFLLFWRLVFKYIEPPLMVPSWTKDASVSFIAATGSHAINTNCSAAHSRQALSCKMAVEYDKFIESGKKWVSLPLDINDIWCLVFILVWIDLMIPSVSVS